MEAPPLTASETTRRHRANRALHQLTRNHYFDAIPLTQIRAVLSAHGFQTGSLDGIYCGATGQADPAQVGDRTWLALSWYRMGTGRYEITCYLS